LANVSPNILYERQYGPNQEVAVRLPAESEVYGLKLMNLVMPRSAHREPRLAELTEHYNATSPLSNENTTASLGVVGTIGLVMLGFTMLAAMCGKSVACRLRWLVIVTAILFLFGTVGGLGSLFGYFVSPSIRGWNRISIFI